MSKKEYLLPDGSLLDLDECIKQLFYYDKRTDRYYDKISDEEFEYYQVVDMMNEEFNISKIYDVRKMVAKKED